MVKIPKSEGTGPESLFQTPIPFLLQNIWIRIRIFFQF